MFPITSNFLWRILKLVMHRGSLCIPNAHIVSYYGKNFGNRSRGFFCLEIKARHPTASPKWQLALLLTIKTHRHRIVELFVNMFAHLLVTLVAAVFLFHDDIWVIFILHKATIHNLVLENGDICDKRRAFNII